MPGHKVLFLMHVFLDFYYIARQDVITEDGLERL